MKVKENRTVLLVSLFIVIALVILTIMGSYAFYTLVLKTTGDGTGVESTTADLKLEFSDGESDIDLKNMIPGDTYTKRFTVQNTGNETVKFQIIIREVTNDFVNQKDVTVQVKENGVVIKDNIQFPTVKAALSDPITIEPQTDARSYEVIVTYNETEDDQTGDMEQALGGTIYIEAVP